MKKMLSVLLAVSVLTSLTACETMTESTSSSAQQDIASATEKIEEVSTDTLMGENSEDSVGTENHMAFGKVLWDAYQRGILPDGHELDYVDMEGASKNSFSITDIDGDGQEELVICWSNACMAGMVTYVFGYQDGSVYPELTEFPDLIFYDNGFVKANQSHNHTPSEDFWPYSIYCYNEEDDTYHFFCGVEAWDRNYYEAYELNGSTFPENIDIDGDGIVYLIKPADWDGHYTNIPIVDGADYEQWSSNYLDGAEELHISMQRLTEENIAVLGYPKPDAPVSQPAG